MFLEVAVWFNLCMLSVQFNICIFYCRISGRNCVQWNLGNIWSVWTEIADFNTHRYFNTCMSVFIDITKEEQNIFCVMYRICPCLFITCHYFYAHTAHSKSFFFLSHVIDCRLIRFHSLLSCIPFKITPPWRNCWVFFGLLACFIKAFCSCLYLFLNFFLTGRDIA